MAADQTFTLYGVKIASTLLGGITSQNMKPGMKVDTPLGSGQARGRAQFIPEGKPSFDFSTYAVASGITALTALGRLIANLSGGVVMYGQYHEEGSTRKTGASHVSYTYASGMIVPVRLTCSDRKYAELAVNGMVTYDGSKAPVVPATGATLPGGLVETEYFGLGPWTVGGVLIPEVTNLDLAFGLNIVARGSESKQFDTCIRVEDIRPVITLKGLAPTIFSAAVVPLNGRVATHANTKGFLRRYDPSTGTFYADNVAQHLKVTAAGLAVISSVDAGQGEAEITVEMPVKFDNTNECLMFDVASTVS